MALTFDKETDKLIDIYMNQPKILYEHLFAGYHQFVSEIIPYSLIQEQNYFYENIEKEIINLHGFKCSNIRIKPSTFENDNEIKFPSDARKNHLNYFATIVADVYQFVEKVDTISGNKTIKVIGNIEKDIHVANIPIMVKSKYCSTHIKQDLKNECKFDPGGYFIVNGAEKIIMSMEKMVDNKILVFSKKESTYENGLIYIAQINSRRNDWSDNLQILTLKNKKNGGLSISTSSQLVDVPIFILMRALGIEDDERIISYITYDLKDIKMINMIRASIISSVDENENPIRTKEEAVEYLITKLKRNKRISQTDENLAKIQKKMYLDKILRQDLLPHLGEDITKKILFIGLIANRLLNVMLGRQELDDRDALHNKRIEQPGILLGQLFRQNWKKLLNDIGKHFKKKNQSDENPINVINQIKPSIIEQSLKTALATGIWGMNKTKKGVAQSLQRLSWVQGISYLRRILSPSMEDSSSKIISIRHINNNQTQMLCLTGDSEVLLSNRNDLTYIKDIYDGNLVTTVNPKTLEQESSSMFNKFKRMSDKLLEIKTISGRIIKATPEHPFLTNNNGTIEWKNAGDLNINDKVIIRHTEKLIIPEKETIVIINELDILKSYYIELLETGYLNKPLHQDKLIIIARLLGAINTCGNINSGINNQYNASFYVDEECDVIALCGDISKLGFGQPLVQRKSGRETWEVLKNGAFAYLLSFLGGFIEEKTINKRIIPEWIMNGNLLIKREFLSAFQGGSDCKIDYQLSDNTFKVSMSSTIQTTLNELEDDTKYYMTQISNLLKDFEITSSISIDNKIIKLDIDNNCNNLCKYVDIIGYRYCYDKKCKSSYVIEHIKIRQETFNYKDFNKDNILYNGIISVNIKEIKEIPNEMVYDFTTRSENHSFIASSFVVSNCPVETPEGAKIGIVKSLAMMSTISNQNSTQYDVLKTILSQSNVKHPYDIDPLTMNKHVKIMLNGDWMGICKISDAYDIYEDLKKKRRENIIDKTTSILFDFKSKEIKCYFDGGRLIRPLLIVNNNKLNFTPEVISYINEEAELVDKSKSWKKIINKFPNLIEYEDIESLNYLLVAESQSRLVESDEAKNRPIEYTNATKINRYGEYRWVKYTHCDFHAWVMMGSVVSNVPFSNHNYAVRNIIHFSQAKQSIGIFMSSYKDRMDISQILYHPQIPIVTTKAMKYNGCMDLPYGENTIIAICSYNGYNQEDSIIFNQSAIDRGIFRADSVKKFESEILKNPSTSQDDIFTKPDRNKVTGMKQGNYDKLNDKGYAPEETILNNEDIMIGKISPIQPTGNNNKVYKDSSTIFKSNVQGVVDRVHTGVYNAEGYEMYNMRVRMERKPISGDKFTCYDDSHEVLTMDGWINIKDVSEKHRIASLNNNKLVYQNPTQIQSYDYEGDMYLVESNQISLCVTPNHRMWVRPRTGKYKAELAQDILHQRRCYKKNVDEIVVDKNTEYFEYNEKGEITHFKIEDEKFEIKNWVSFFGIWLAEGRVDKYPDNKKIGKYLLHQNVEAINKLFPEWVWNLSIDLCRKLIDGMMLGGGHTMENGTRRYDTLSIKLADGFQKLCLHAGYSTNIIIKYKAGHCSQEIKMNHVAYQMTIIESQVEPLVNKNIKKKDGIITNNHDNMIPYKGKVYCCTVPGEGVMVIRRNGIVCLSGNSRHGQKGTIGITYKQKDMPFTESGMVPDMILNPHGYPSRMSLGHFIECLASKEAAATGHFVDGTPFNNYDISQIPESLKKLGYSPYGTEVMYCGLTGRKMDVEIFIGPVYSIRLKHMVLDKVHGRARGPRQALTRQPLEGRSRDGGLKIGEMEKDAIVAHGMSQFLKERLMETSDISKAYVCDECGMFASKVIDKDYYRCKGCHNSTRISAVVIPYACKLLFQELTSVNILPRIRTEKSIYSDET